MQVFVTVLVTGPGETLVQEVDREFSEGGVAVLVAFQVDLAMRPFEVITYSIDFDFTVRSLKMTSVR